MKALRLAAGLAVAMAFGCGPNIDLTNRPLFTNGGNTVTFLLYDALSGAPINTGASVNVQIGEYQLAATQQGTTNSYVVTGVPNITPVVTLSATGFHTMVAQPSLFGGPSNPTPTNQNFINFQVGLYPQGAVANPFTIRVFDRETGAAITNGTLTATLTNLGNFGAPLSDTLAASPLFLPSVISQPIGSSGTVTIPPEQMIFGATYSVDVYGATNADGETVVPAQNVTFVVGTASSGGTQLNVFVGSPTITPVALSVNNEDASQENRTIVVTFPYEVEVCPFPPAPEPYFLIASGTNGDLDGTFTTPADPSIRAIAAPAANGNWTVTVTPQFAVQPEPEDGPLSLYAYDVQVRVAGATSACTDLDFVSLRGSGTVNMSIRWDL